MVPREQVDPGHMRKGNGAFVYDPMNLDDLTALEGLYPDDILGFMRESAIAMMDPDLPTAVRIRIHDLCYRAVDALKNRIQQVPLQGPLAPPPFNGLRLQRTLHFKPKPPEPPPFEPCMPFASPGPVTTAVYDGITYVVQHMPHLAGAAAAVLGAATLGVGICDNCVTNDQSDTQAIVQTSTGSPEASIQLRLPSSWMTVKQDSTMAEFAISAGYNPADVARLNGNIDVNSPVTAGEWLYVPTTKSHYVVQPGDTLGHISGITRVPLADLILRNPQFADPNLIKSGDIVNLLQK